MNVKRHTVVTLTEKELQEAAEEWVRQRFDNLSSKARVRFTRTPHKMEAEVTFEEPVDVTELTSKVRKLQG